ncbi:hypothetical protein [Methylophaga thiooxydans]|uniref:hypothetical protein n=1 Tax=Methylophaga thiooxydans TaxID=392484 RepID=UPI002352D9A6|nr:hypothetical protein [Methylophaga thiooxydans]
MKRHQLLSLMLTLCMVFSTSASAFLHLGEHQHDQSHSTNQPDAHQHHLDSHDDEDDHAHHFNLHVVGDLVEFESPSLIRTLTLASCDYSSQLISRSYSPPLPPPNA